MENNALTTGFRARASQLLTWLLGPVQQQRQQQTMQADRQVYDGVTRGMDDPDNRRQQQTPGQQPAVPYLEEGTRQAQREILERWQDAQRAHGIEPKPALDHASTHDRRPADTLAAQVEALQQRLQAQQQARQQGRGQGRGW